MNLISEMEINQEKLDELGKLGVKLSPEQIESLKYEAIGRALTKTINIFNAESGRIITTDFFDGIWMASISRLISRDTFVITPEVQPLFNIKNEYMGFLYYGKIRNIKKEKKRRKNIRTILSAITMVMAFVIGFKASIFITIAFIIALLSFGYSSFLLCRVEG